MFPPSILKNRHCHDFEEFQISKRDTLDDKEFANEIAGIGNYVFLRHSELRQKEKQVCAACVKFSIPTEKSIQPWLKGMLPPKQRLP